MKCFYILLCPVKGMASFLMSFRQQSHVLHIEETGTWQQNTLNQTCLEIGKYKKDYFFLVGVGDGVIILPLWNKASNMVWELHHNRKINGEKNE